MKLCTTPEQTAKLIGLGFKKPRIDAGVTKWEGYEPICTGSYTLGELIEMLDGVSGLEITQSDSDWGVYDDLRAFTGEELIDNLYDMILKLKEEGVI